MTYIAAADFRLGGLQPWTATLTMTEQEGTDAYLDAVIAGVTTRVEMDLDDDFEPPTPDNDETFVTEGSGLDVWHVPRRVRSLTSVKTRDDAGTQTTQTAYRLSSSLNAAGTAMVGKLDSLQIVSGFTVPCWPTALGSIELVGKFGWAAVPHDIKRLVALLVYDWVKASADPLHTIIQKNTIDAQFTYGPSAEVTDIMDRYRRVAVMSS